MSNFRTEWVQRQYDGKWVMYGYVPDPNENIEDAYHYGIFRWVQLTPAYDFMVELHAS